VKGFLECVSLPEKAIIVTVGRESKNYFEQHNLSQNYTTTANGNNFPIFSHLRQYIQIKKPLTAQLRKYGFQGV